MRVILAGTGCGGPGSMTEEVRQEIGKAALLIGAPRLLASIDAPEGCGKFPAVRTEEIIERILSGKESEILVLFSGDSGFYSGARLLFPKLREKGIEAKILPGISSLQVLSARLGRPWQDWKLVSAHGTECDPVSQVMEGKPVFFLTGGELGPGDLCRRLTDAGLGDLRVTIAERLSYPEERITEGKAEEFSEASFDTLSVMLAEACFTRGDLTPGIEDGAFIRGSVPMTKQDVRAVILGRMKIGPGDTIWDVGAGTGSVSVEMAMKARGGRVYAVERDPEGIELIRKNRERFGAWNIEVVEGEAPEALADLPAPDAVFIGGSRGRLREIFSAVLSKNPDAGILVSAILIETLAEAVSAMADLGLEASVTHMAVTRSRELGTKHMMTAENPIYIISGKKN